MNYLVVSLCCLSVIVKEGQIVIYQSQGRFSGGSLEISEASNIKGILAMDPTVI